MGENEGRAICRGVRLDAETNRLLGVMAGRRYDGNASMTVRAALRLAAQAWGVPDPPPAQEAVT